MGHFLKMGRFSKEWGKFWKWGRNWKFWSARHMSVNCALSPNESCARIRASFINDAHVIWVLSACESCAGIRASFTNDACAPNAFDIMEANCSSCFLSKIDGRDTDYCGWWTDIDSDGSDGIPQLPRKNWQPDAKTMTDCQNWRLDNFPFTVLVDKMPAFFGEMYHQKCEQCYFWVNRSW